MHFTTREDYYSVLVLRGLLIFNVRSDPFESYDNKDSYGRLAQRVWWLFQPVTELIEAHLQTLAEYPPVQGRRRPRHGAHAVARPAQRRYRGSTRRLGREGSLKAP